MAGLPAAAVPGSSGRTTAFNENNTFPCPCPAAAAAPPFRTGVAMMPRAIHILSTFSIAAGMALLVVACSMPLQRQHDLAAHANQHAALIKITQLNFGRDATFAFCIEPACPAVTRKTLPVAPQAFPRSETPAPAPGNNAAASLDPGEVLLTARHPPRDVISAPAKTPRAPVVVYFDSGSAALDQAARAALDQAVAGAHATDRIAITGRTDNAGSNRINQALALARARAVRDYLRASQPSRNDVFTLDARGACCFTASNDTPEGRRQNRRVEIVFGVPGQVAP